MNANGTYYSDDETITSEGRTVKLVDVVILIRAFAERARRDQTMDDFDTDADGLDFALQAAYDPEDARKLILASDAGRFMISVCPVVW